MYYLLDVIYFLLIVFKSKHFAKPNFSEVKELIEIPKKSF